MSESNSIFDVFLSSPEVPEAVARLLVERAYAEVARSLRQQLAGTAVKPQARQVLTRLLGFALMQCEDFCAADNCFQEIKSRAELSGDRREVALCNLQLAILARLRLDFVLARDYLKAALSRWNSHMVPYFKGLSRIYFELGLACIGLDEISDCTVYFELVINYSHTVESQFEDAHSRPAILAGQFLPVVLSQNDDLLNLAEEFFRRRDDRQALLLLQQIRAGLAAQLF